MNDSKHEIVGGRHAVRPPITLFVAAGLCILMAAPGSADAQTAGRKAARGLAAMTTGFLEIPGNVVKSTREEGPVVGATVGLALGCGKLVARELIGVYEFVTAPFALPSGFAPILQPEFPWQYFESGPPGDDAFAGLAPAIDIGELERIDGAVVSRRGGTVIVEFPQYVRFTTGSAALSDGARGRLNELAATIRRHSKVGLAVYGHTDSVGDATLNLELSGKRAAAVREYLIGRGIDRESIFSKGYGETRPVADNDTPEGRLRNRRVEIAILRAG